jgi:hypothetical protein
MNLIRSFSAKFAVEKKHKRMNKNMMLCTPPTQQQPFQNEYKSIPINLP